MTRLLLPLLAIALSLPLNGAHAGPNAGGTLFLHANPNLTYTTDSDAYCPLTGLSRCAQAVTGVSGSATFVIQAIAAFPEGSAPRLSGITFGVQYDASVLIVDHGSCGDFLLADTSWPASGTGAAIAWSSPGTSLLEPVYWFAAYNEDSPAAAHFELTPHATQGGSFGDDHVPSILDPIAAFGAIGFDTPGTFACPPSSVDLGACCLPHQECAIYTGAECEDLGGVPQGAGTTCSPNPCPGACCFKDGTCRFVRPDECSENFLGPGTSCDPNPCPFPLGACCLPNGDCSRMTQALCLAQEGLWRGEDTSCDPYPCLSPIPGACCIPGGPCILVAEQSCEDQYGLYQGPDTICDPDGSCPGPVGACCLESGCSPRSLEQCLSAQGEFAGEYTSCDPNPCASAEGACCAPDGTCGIASAEDCASGGGEYLGDGVPCEPSPCVPVSVERKTWGQLKDHFRRESDAHR